MMDIDELRKLLELRDGQLYWRVAPSKTRVDLVGKLAGGTHPTKAGYKYIGIRGKRYYAHRVVFALVYGYWPSRVDHKNHDREDNSPLNLREATPQQNNQNQQVRQGRKYKGVYPQKLKSGKIRYRAMYSTAQGTRGYAGCFDTEEQAARAYNQAILREHGKFAVLNEVKDD